jgi:hypothetical protein
MADGQLAELMKCIMTIEHLLSRIAEGSAPGSRLPGRDDHLLCGRAPLLVDCANEIGSGTGGPRE